MIWLKNEKPESASGKFFISITCLYRNNCRVNCSLLNSFKFNKLYYTFFNIFFHSKKSICPQMRFSNHNDPLETKYVSSSVIPHLVSRWKCTVLFQDKNLLTLWSSKGPHLHIRSYLTLYLNCLLYRCRLNLSKFRWKS